jgi:hypothetical protein
MNDKGIVLLEAAGWWQEPLEGRAEAEAAVERGTARRRGIPELVFKKSGAADCLQQLSSCLHHLDILLYTCTAGCQSARCKLRRCLALGLCTVPRKQCLAR